MVGDGLSVALTPETSCTRWMANCLGVVGKPTTGMCLPYEMLTTHQFPRVTLHRQSKSQVNHNIGGALLKRHKSRYTPSFPPHSKRNRSRTKRHASYAQLAPETCMALLVRVSFAAGQKARPPPSRLGPDSRARTKRSHGLILSSSGLKTKKGEHLSDCQSVREKKLHSVRKQGNCLTFGRVRRNMQAHALPRMLHLSEEGMRARHT